MSTRITKRLVDAATPVPGRDIWLWDSEIKLWPSRTFQLTSPTFSTSG